MQHPRHCTVTSTPHPSPFSHEHARDRALRIQTVGRAVDDVVGAFVAVADDGKAADSAELLRFAAAARRLWTMAFAAYRAAETSS